MLTQQLESKMKEIPIPFTEEQMVLLDEQKR